MPYTPGPWMHLSGGHITTSAGSDWPAHVVCNLNNGRGEALPNTDANARLIAAAPDLLAALESLRAELRDHIKFDVKRHYSLMVADVVADKAIHKAKAAT